MKTKLLIILIFLTLCSCSTPINNGVVTEKHFKAKHSAPIPMGRTMGMKTVPDSYQITFEKDTVIKIRRTVTVSKEIYNSYQLGDSIVIN